MKLNKTEKKEKSIVELEVAVLKDEFEAAIEKAYRKNAKNIAISETGIIMLLFIKLIALFIFSNMYSYIYIHMNNAIVDPINPIVKPSTINGILIKLSLPPTYFIISISSFLLYTIAFIVFDIITKHINIKNIISI